MSRAGVDSLWLHVGADVVDPGVRSAVDSPEPGGLLPDLLGELVGHVASADGFCGMYVTILDPALDKFGEQVGILVDLLAAGLCPGK